MSSGGPGWAGYDGSDFAACWWVGRRGSVYYITHNSVVPAIHSFVSTCTVVFMLLDVGMRYSIHLAAYRGGRLLECDVKLIKGWIISCYPRMDYCLSHGLLPIAWITLATALGYEPVWDVDESTGFLYYIG